MDMETLLFISLILNCIHLFVLLTNWNSRSETVYLLRTVLTTLLSFNYFLRGEWWLVGLWVFMTVVNIILLFTVNENSRREIRETTYAYRTPKKPNISPAPAKFEPKTVKLYKCLSCGTNSETNIGLCLHCGDKLPSE